MADKKGTGLLMVWVDVPADKEEEFNRWYNEEHIPEILSIPGVLSGARYEAVKSGPKYLACYELDNPQVALSESFTNRPRTEWAQRIGPRVIGTSFIRNVYKVIHPPTLSRETAESGMAPALQIGRMDVIPEHEAEWHQWYNTVYVPNYEKVPGCIRGRRLMAVDGKPQYGVCYELESEKVPEGAEWNRIREINPDNPRMRSYMLHAPGSPGVWRKIFEL